MKDAELKLPEADIRAIDAYFAPPALTDRPEGDAAVKLARLDSKSFSEWLDQNVVTHRHPDYAAVTISLKGIGEVPGDASDSQMEAVADIAEKYAFDELRVSHEQNLILPHVARADLKAVYDALVDIGLATANSNLITDIISCPGLDYCALATARSIPIAQEISQRFASLERQREIGELKLKISGCINACGHHHVGHIGILGVEKKGSELYQVTLGGSADENTSVGEIIGRGFSSEEITDAIETDRRDLSRPSARPTENSSTPTAVSVPRRSRRRSMLAKPRPLDRIVDVDDGIAAKAAGLDALYGHLKPLEIIERSARELFHDEIAAVSSFGADSAVLLHMIAEIDRTLPVIFLDTGKHFEETLGYRDALVADFGLTNIRVIKPEEAALERIDPTGNLHQTNTDACCDVRKVEPLARGVGAVPRLVHRPQALPGLDAGSASGLRGGRPAHPHQPAGALDDIGPGRLHARPCAARKSAGRLWLSVDRLLSRARSRCSRARTRAAAAGPVTPRPSAASTCRGWRSR